MSDPTRATGNVPSIIDREDTGVIVQNERMSAAEKIAILLERYENLKATAVTKEILHQEVTGARKSIELGAVSQFADKDLFGELVKTVADLKPKAKEIPWLAIIGLVLAVIGPIALLIWNAAHYPDRREFEGLAEKVTQLRIDAAAKGAKP